MPGFDYGLEHHLAVLTAPEFNFNLRAANIIARGYGAEHNNEVDAEVPVVMLVAKKPDLLKQAFVQLKTWIDATGPDALSVEILYSGEGYHISFGPEADHLLWRTVGLDQTIDPLILGLTYIKKIDTRNRFVDDLANRARLPVAPVIISGAQYTGPEQPRRTPGPSDIQPIPGCPDLFLLKLPVYRHPSDVPPTSGLISCTRSVSERSSASSRESVRQEKRPPARCFDGEKHDSRRSRQLRFTCCARFGRFAKNSPVWRMATLRFGKLSRQSSINASGRYLVRRCAFDFRSQMKSSALCTVSLKSIDQIGWALPPITTTSFSKRGETFASCSKDWVSDNHRPISMNASCSSINKVIFNRGARRDGVALLSYFCIRQLHNRRMCRRTTGGQEGNRGS